MFAWFIDNWHLFHKPILVFQFFFPTEKKKLFTKLWKFLAIDVNFRVGNMKLTHLFAWGKCKGHKCKQPCIKDMQRYKMSGTFSFVPMYCDQDISYWNKF